MTTPAVAPTQIHHRRQWLHKLFTFWTLIVVVSAIAVGIFADIGEDVAEQSTTVFDEAVRAWLIAHRAPVLYQLAYIVTWAGSPIVMVVLAIVAGIWFYQRHGHRKAGIFVAAPAVGGLFSGAVKQLYGRARPPGGGLLNERTYSFPSGHALTSAAVMVTLSYVMAPEKLISWPTAVIVGGGGALFVGLAGFFFGGDLASDVVGGWAAGLFLARLSYAGWHYLRREAPSPAEDAAAEATEKQQPKLNP